MDTKYIGKKTGKMGAQLGGNNAVALAIFYLLKRTGIELTPDETVVYMAAWNIIGPMIIKFVEKLTKK